MAQRKKALPVGTVEQIREAQDLKEDTVEIPEWGCAVKLRGLTKKQSQELVEQATDPKSGIVDENRFEMLVMVNCCVEPDFTEADIDWLREKAALPVSQLIHKSLAVSGLGGASMEDALRRFLEESDT